MSAHSFFLAVPTRAAARTKATCRGRFAQVYTDPKYREWLNEAVPALEALRPKLTDTELEADVSIEIEVAVERPKATKRRRPGGDSDNYEKGIWDALTKAGWWKDDEQVTHNSTWKRWTHAGEPPGYHVRIKYLTDK